MQKLTIVHVLALWQVIVATAPGTRLSGDQKAQALLDAVHAPFAPDKVVVVVEQVRGVRP